MSRVGVSFALLAFAFAVPASAALYKWTDASGRVVYSDQPPPVSANVKVETIAGAPPPANPNAVKEMAAKELDMKKRMTDAAEKEKKADADRIQLAKRAEQCQRSQSQLKQLSSDQIALEIGRAHV